MIKCNNCGTDSQDSCQFCDECGTRLIHASGFQDEPAYVPPIAGSVTTVSPNNTFASPVNGANDGAPLASRASAASSSTDKMNAVVVIERGDPVGHEFKVVGTECVIGRWDADNGVFPDIDLDAFDSEAKVSRRHARIRKSNGEYTVEDLGSTNGTYLNRGRRLIPGMPQAIKSGDELIVGKTFLRFRSAELNQ